MPESIQYLLFVGFAGLLFLLRLDARRFGAAEWDDERDGLRAWLPRLSWYVLGLALSLLVFALHPQPVSQLNLELGADRQTAMGYGIIYAVAGTVAAFMLAWLRYGRISLPPLRRYPGAAIGSIGTAFIDEFLFRGVVFGLLLGLGLPVWAAVLAAAFIYVGSVWASAGSQGVLGLVLVFALGVAGSILVLLTGGIGAAVVGHAATRFALFMFTGRRGSAAGRRRRPLDTPGLGTPGSGWGSMPGDRGGREATDPSGSADGASRPSADGPRPALYIHVPFCVSICPYCDFVVVAGRRSTGPTSLIERVTAALHAELDLRADAHVARMSGPAPRAGMALASVYFGGGTPSLLPSTTIDALLRHVERRFGLTHDVEVSLEANPGPDELGDLQGLRAAGVTRLSLGAQSLQPAELRRLGRRHTAADVVTGVRQARRAGFRSVSLDLLTDVPTQTVESWRDTLTRALDLGPDHLSTYALALADPDAEGSTGPLGDHLPLRPGARRWRDRAIGEQSDDRAAEMEGVTDELCEAAGLAWYEIANRALPGHACRHNLVYWQRGACEAVGPGAHAFDGARVRRWNAAHLPAYLASLLPAHGPPTLPPGGAEVLSPSEARSESAILALRLASGIPLAAATDPELAEGLAWAAAAGLTEIAGGRVRLTRRGRLLAGEVFLRLLPTQDRPDRARLPTSA